MRVALERGRAEHDRLREHLALGAGDAVHVVDAAAAAGVVQLHVAHHRVRDEGQPSGGRGRRQRAGGARVVGAGRAPAAAGAAVVAGRTSTHGRGEDRRAPDGEGAPELLLERLARDHLAAVERHGRQEHAVGKLRDAFGLSADADEALDPVVVGRELGVLERPVRSEAVAARRLHVVVADAVALTAPHDRLAAHVPAADPGERAVLGRRVRAVVVVDEQVVRVLVALVALLLDRLLLLQGPGRPLAAQRHLVGELVLGVVDGRVELAPGLQHRHRQAGLGQLPGRPAAGRAGADHDRVEDVALGHG